MAPNPDRGELIPMAAGERIVAFVGPGKLPEIPFLTVNETSPVQRKHP